MFERKKSTESSEKSSEKMYLKGKKFRKFKNNEKFQKESSEKMYLK